MSSYSFIEEYVRPTRKSSSEEYSSPYREAYNNPRPNVGNRGFPVPHNANLANLVRRNVPLYTQIEPQSENNSSSMMEVVVELPHSQNQSPKWSWGYPAIATSPTLFSTFSTKVFAAVLLVAIIGLIIFIFVFVYKNKKKNLSVPDN